MWKTVTTKKIIHVKDINILDSYLNVSNSHSRGIVGIVWQLSHNIHEEKRETSSLTLTHYLAKTTEKKRTRPTYDLLLHGIDNGDKSSLY